MEYLEIKVGDFVYSIDVNPDGTFFGGQKGDEMKVIKIDGDNICVEENKKTGKLSYKKDELLRREIIDDDKLLAVRLSCINEIMKKKYGIRKK